jgi:hypothetical protein
VILSTSLYGLTGMLFIFIDAVRQPLVCLLCVCVCVCVALAEIGRELNSHHKPDLFPVRCSRCGR